MNMNVRSLRPWVGLAALVSGLAAAVPAQAAVVIAWNSPVLSGAVPVGTSIALSGNANTSGVVGGTGLDLVLVLDTSGSMADVESGQTRSQWMKQASIALVQSLPASTSAVGVVDFDSVARLVTPLTGLAGGVSAVQTGINGLNASGGTNIGVGIDAATAELTSARHTAGRVQMMVVVSDGSSSGNPPAAASTAVTAGVEAVHAVGIPGHLGPQMQAIATAGNGVYTNASNLSALTSLFDGTGGNLVGLDRIDLLLNDGSALPNVAIDALGNFTTPALTILAGLNTFTATAFDTLGNSASSTLTIFGGTSTAVPEPAPWVLLVLALIAGRLCKHGARRGLT